MSIVLSRRMEDIQLTTYRWPFPQDAIDEVKAYINYGDLTELAEQVDSSIFKIWDHLNRKRSKYDIRIMLAVVKMAERNRGMMTDDKLPKFKLRKFIDKIYRYYQTAEQPKLKRRVRP